MHPTPPPATAPAAVADTRANKLRARYTQRLKEAGAFDFKADKEARAAAAAAENLQKRAAEHVAKERRAARARVEAAVAEAAAGGGGGESKGAESAPLATDRFVTLQDAHDGTCTNHVAYVNAKDRALFVLRCMYSTQICRILPALM